ncbi:MAG: DUF1330 domain-containing protein [Gemmatimonadales bacterium]
MPAYVIVQIDIEDPATYERYKALAPASIAAYGGPSHASPPRS